MIGDDLSGILLPPLGPDVGFRQGVIVAFNPATGANDVNVAGGTLTDVPLLNMGDTVNLVAGDVVVLIRYRSSWAILGRLVVPGSAELNSTAVGFDSIGVSGQNFALTTSFDAKTSDLIEVPTWANRMLLHATADASVENPTASNDIAYLRVGIASVSGGTAYQPVSAAGTYPGRYASLAASAVREVVVTGGDLHIVVAEMRTSVGPWAADPDNIVNLNATAIFRKA